MITKFISIKNIGKFRNCCAQGDVELRKLTLIYAENGRGKTTLGAILRSLQTNDANHAMERRTLDSTDSPQIEIRTQNGICAFRDGAWNTSYPSLAIFDSTYVSQNVYSGDYVEHDHKKNLARIIVGEQGVALATRVDELDTAIRNAGTQVATAKIACDKFVPQGFTTDQFLRLLIDVDVDEKINRKRQEVAAITHAAEIGAKAALAVIALPTPPANVDNLLAKDLPDVPADAEAKVRNQIEIHRMEADGQGWLSRGLQYIRETTCPFCGQGITANDLVAAYRSFFSEGYRNFKAQIEGLDLDVRESFSDRKIATVQNTLVQNEALLEFWRQYVPCDSPSLSFALDVVPVLNEMHDLLLRHVARKLASPLEVIVPSEELVTAREHLAELAAKITAYNTAIAVINVAVEAKRRETATGNLVTAKRELLQLEATKVRHTTEVVAVCDAYQNALNNKRILEEGKRGAKEALETYSNTVLDRYETRINNLLKRFHAGFRITGSRFQYVGGNTSSSYKLSINDVPVDLGAPNTPPGTPCFRTTMSAGDRSTLALAFFLVQLQERQDLATLTVVMDDPFTSLDAFRQHATGTQIHKLIDVAKQVIVMSHYPTFLGLVADKIVPHDLRTLCIDRKGTNDSVILQWDMQATLASGYDQDLATLTEYHHGDTNDMRGVMRCIRPVLECYIRRRCPGHFPPKQKEWLGDMLDIIRNAQDGDAITEVKAKYDDMSDLNDYTKRYHHDDNTSRTDAEPINATELQGYVTTTLEIVGKL